jgi:hypothetical protein|tara:strand:- start:175 stop:285 length:111 start_codon:yes stop_codon:yes gene_type:complete
MVYNKLIAIVPLIAFQMSIPKSLVFSIGQNINRESS